MTQSIILHISRILSNHFKKKKEKEITHLESWSTIIQVLQIKVFEPNSGWKQRGAGRNSGMAKSTGGKTTTSDTEEGADNTSTLKVVSARSKVAHKLFEDKQQAPITEQRLRRKGTNSR